MTIGYDGSRAFLSLRTGTENYSYQLLCALSAVDRKNRYLIYIRPGVKVRKWPENFFFKTVGLKRFWTQLGLAGQTMRDDLDLLFIPAHTLPVIHKPGLKTVVTVHDLGAEYLPAYHQFKQLLYLKWMTVFQLKSASKLIAVSKATKEDIVKRCKIDPKKIEVVYEGYDEELFKLVKGEVLVNRLKQYDIIAGEYFLFVGTVQPRKNLERLIEAFSRVILSETKDLSRMRPSNKLRDSSLVAQNDKLQLVIAGSKGWLSNKIYKLPKRLGIEHKVKFLGYVADEKLPALYSGAKALLFPSLFEGFGLPILEAQACGCPVLTSNTSSMPEVAGKGAIYVDPYNIDDIVKGMERLKREGERGKLIKAGFENIKRFSWEKCARETLRVFGDL